MLPCGLVHQLLHVEGKGAATCGFQHQLPLLWGQGSVSEAEIVPEEFLAFLTGEN